MIIKREKDRSYGIRLNFKIKKRKSRSIRIVTDKVGGGAIREHEENVQVEEAIFSDIHDQRFHLAEHAPIYRGNLRGECGYHAAT